MRFHSKKCSESGTGTHTPPPLQLCSLSATIVPCSRRYHMSCLLYLLGVSYCNGLYCRGDVVIVAKEKSFQ